MKDDTSGLTQLGSQGTRYDQAPSCEVLETFPNQYPGRDYEVVFDTDEFTSLCPKTGQPDFASLCIRYVPDQKCVESKSLKLYLFAYRNEGSFMETICNRVLEDLVGVTEPRSMTVEFDFKARGGITTRVRCHYERSQ